MSKSTDAALLEAMFPAEPTPRLTEQSLRVQRHLRCTFGEADAFQMVDADGTLRGIHVLVADWDFEYRPFDDRARMTAVEIALRGLTDSDVGKIVSVVALDPSEYMSVRHPADPAYRSDRYISQQPAGPADRWIRRRRAEAKRSFRASHRAAVDAADAATLEAERTPMLTTYEEAMASKPLRVEVHSFLRAVDDAGENAVKSPNGA